MDRFVAKLEERVTLVYAGVIAAAAVLLLWQQRGTSFSPDEWWWILRWGGWRPGELLQPDAGHLVLLPVLAHRLTAVVFGLDSFVPFRLESVAAGIAVSVLLFVYARRRIGAAAIFPATIVLFLGSAWDMVLSGAGLQPQLALIGGVGALVALDRGDRRGDLGACGLLVAAVAAFETGLPFVAGAAVRIAITDRRAAWRRAWVVAVPAALYLAWKLWSTKFPGAPAITLDNVANLPVSMIDAFAGTLSALTGLGKIEYWQGFPVLLSLDWGRVLWLPAVALLGWQLWRRRSFPPGLWATLVMVLAYWASIALTLGSFRRPDLTRYTYAGAVFLLLFCVEAFAGRRLSRNAVLALSAAVVIAIVGNLGNMRLGGNYLRTLAPVDLAQLSALDAARPNLERGGSPRFDGLIPTRTFNIVFTPREYYSAVDRYGTPAYPAATLHGRSEQARQAADLTFGFEYQLALVPTTRPPGGSCVTLKPPAPLSAAGTPELVVPPGGLVLSAARGPVVTVKLRRFADGFSYTAGKVAGGSAARLTVPADGLGRPWRAQVAAAQAVRACRA